MAGLATTGRARQGVRTTGRCAVNSIRYFALFAVPLMAMPSFAEEANPKLLPSIECATRDTHFILQLEQYGEQGSMPGDKLYAAYRTMLRARTACSSGRSAEGLALYDSSFGPVRDTASVNERPEMVQTGQ